MARNKRRFNEALHTNNVTYLYYYNRLVELAVSTFEWKNLPPTVDERYLEMALCTNGSAVFFQDDVIENYLCLKVVLNGKFDVYGIPTNYMAIGENGYNMKLDNKNSVLIFNNYLHHNSISNLEMFAKRLYDLDRTIDINARSQKTPVFIQCDENQRLTLENAYMQFDGNVPVIFADKKLNPNDINVLKTDSPYVADKIYELKTQIWNEALTYLGIANLNIQKKERLVSDEVTRSQGGTISSRHSRLESRRKAVEKINEMFNLNISVDYREIDYNELKYAECNINGGVNNE